jgi:hypothetical protein
MPNDTNQPNVEKPDHDREATSADEDATKDKPTVYGPPAQPAVQSWTSRFFGRIGWPKK